ncbi:MAG: nucleotidyltransferase family protein [bacterium]
MARNQAQLEKRCVRLLSRIELNQSAREQVGALLKGPLDWQRIEALAVKEGVAGLLYNHLSHLDCVEGDSECHLVELRHRYFVNVANALRTEQELRVLLKALELDKVAILVFKGIALVQNVYRKSGLRGYCDVDILVRDEEWPGMLTVLLRLGYRSMPEYPNWFSNGRLDIDLHRDPFGFSKNPYRQLAFNLDTRALWRDSRMRLLAGHPVRQFSLEDELLVLSAHAVKHSFEKMIWVVDLAEMVNRYAADIDWDTLLQKAYQSKLDRPLYFIFQWARTHLEVTIPDFVVRGLQPQPQVIAEKLLYRGIDCGKETPKVAELIYFSAIQGFCERIKFMCEAVCPRDSIRKQIYGWYHTPLAFCFLILRLIQTAFFGLRLSCQLLFR